VLGRSATGDAVVAGFSFNLKLTPTRGMSFLWQFALPTSSSFVCQNTAVDEYFSDIDRKRRHDEPTCTWCDCRDDSPFLNRRRRTAQTYEVTKLVPGSAFHGVHGLGIDKAGHIFAGSVAGRALYEVDLNNGTAKIAIPTPEGMADEDAAPPAIPRQSHCALHDLCHVLRRAGWHDNLSDRRAR
jgi:hypothetical protein